MNKILVPTDGSERAEHAADFAIELAKGTGAALRFIYVVDEVSPTFAYELESGASIDIVAIAAQRTQYGEEAVARLKEKAEAAGITTESEVIDGHPSEEILKDLKHSGSDHIVIGSHGRRALGAAMLGSVAVNVIHSAEVPVTVIPWHKKQGGA